MTDVILSPNARQTMDRYFEDYVGSQNNNDLTKRAFYFSRILKCLSQIHTMDVYAIDDKNFVKIENICIVEYELTDNDSQLIVQNIYFYEQPDEKVQIKMFRY